MIIFRQRRCCTSSRKLFLSPSYLLIAFVQDCALYLIGIILFWCCKKTVCIIYFSEGRGGNLLFVCIFSALKTRLFKVDWYVLEHVSLKNIISCKKNKDFCWFNFTCSFYIPLDPDSWPKWIRIHILICSAKICCTWKCPVLLVFMHKSFNKVLQLHPSPARLHVWCMWCHIIQENDRKLKNSKMWFLRSRPTRTFRNCPRTPPDTRRGLRSTRRGWRRQRTTWRRRQASSW